MFDEGGGNCLGNDDGIFHGEHRTYYANFVLKRLNNLLENKSVKTLFEITHIHIIVKLIRLKFI